MQGRAWFGEADFRRQVSQKGRLELDRAVELQPYRTDYPVELAQLYIDFPEYFRGGLDRAADVLEPVPPDWSTRDDLCPRLATARQAHRDAGWRLERMLIWVTTLSGYGMPWL